MSEIASATERKTLSKEQTDYLLVATIAKVKENFGLTLSHRLLVSTPPSFMMYEWHQALCMKHNIPCLSQADFNALWSKAGHFVWQSQKAKGK